MVMGAPVSTRLERWAMARSVVAGRFVNAYSRRDWVLGLIYRGANGNLLPVVCQVRVFRVTAVEAVLGFWQLQLFCQVFPDVMQIPR